jgi:UDP-N-acetylglucosamine 1-carboxyvinyltransferase
MDKFVIHGGKPIRGKVRVNGSKNSALPILIATLLTDETCVIDNVPNLRDIRTTYKLLEELGKKITVKGKKVRIEYRRKLKTKAPYDLVKQMRASILVAGPLLARFGKARVSLPGGCAIGLRPIDIHSKAFEALGAETANAGGDLLYTAKKIRSGKAAFRFASVGATENVMTLAAATPGDIIIENAAREPEIEDLADFLNKMGATVTGAGTRRIRIRGAQTLAGVRHTVIADRIETGTLLLACGAAGGKLTLAGAVPDHLEAVIESLKKSGAEVKTVKGGLEICAPLRPRPVSIRTKVHPGFPTDLQAPWMAYMCRAKGKSRVNESIFERRYLHAAELGRLGARISVDGPNAVVDGVPVLQGATIMASDIRAGAALIIAGLSAQGVTEIHRVYHIDRGYERIERKLRSVGARIRRVAA